MIKLLIIVTLLSVAVSCGVSFSTAHAMESDCFITDVEAGQISLHDGIQRYWVNRVCYDGGWDYDGIGYITYGSLDTIEDINKHSDENFYTTDPVRIKIEGIPTMPLSPGPRQYDLDGP